MVQLIPLIIILPFIAFYAWMFWDMVNNDDLPNNSVTPATWPPSSKFSWTVAFVFLNIFAAGFYYFTEYKKR